jgi:hypothetical protein
MKFFTGFNSHQGLLYLQQMPQVPESPFPPAVPPGQLVDLREYRAGRQEHQADLRKVQAVRPAFLQLEFPASSDPWEASGSRQISK